MMNFDFYNPTRIIFGKDRFETLDQLIPATAKVLITYGGGSVEKFGTLDKTVQALGNREIVKFAGIEPNPRYETLMKAAELAKAEQVDFVLAVGGGSVIDGTKFIIQAAAYEGDAETLLYSGFGGTPVEKALPFGAILTLPATGSEMNCGAVVSFKDGKFPVFNQKVAFPQFSLLDPTLTFTLPKKQVANGVIDAFIHVVEQYITYPANGRFQDRTAEGILQTLIEIGPETYENPEDYEARANLVWCATNALNGLIGAGVPQDWTTHMIGHELTAQFGIDHGQTLAIIQPSVWRVRKEQKRAKLLQYAERVWQITEGTEDEKIEAAIAKTEAFFHSLDVKTKLSDYGIGADKVQGLVDALEAHGMTAISEDGTVDLTVSRQIIEASL